MPLGWALAGSAVLGLIGGERNRQASSQASSAQVGSAQAGIDNQNRQLEIMRALLEPYTQAGLPALQQQQALLGLGGKEAQQAAIDAIQNGVGFQEAISQGENAMRQNASATGGLRGGNFQAALAQFRPSMLAQAINDQYSRLGGMTQLGQNSAAGVGAAGMQSANSIGNLLQQQGAARAGGYLGQANAQNQMLGSIFQGFGSMYGSGAFGKSNSSNSTDAAYLNWLLG